MGTAQHNYWKLCSCISNIFLLCIVSSCNTLKTLTSSVHSGLFCCFHNQRLIRRTFAKSAQNSTPKRAKRLARNGQPSIRWSHLGVLNLPFASECSCSPPNRKNIWWFRLLGRLDLHFCVHSSPLQAYIRLHHIIHKHQWEIMIRFREMPVTGWYHSACDSIEGTSTSTHRSGAKILFFLSLSFQQDINTVRSTQTTSPPAFPPLPIISPQLQQG